MGRHEGNIRKEPEAKRVRALLSNLRLDLRTSGYDYQNSFQEHVQRLEDLGSIASESMHVDWFIDHIDNPDYECVVEALKASPGVSLETRYSRVLCKAADVAKPKPRDQNALTPREMRIRLPDKPSPFQKSNDNVDLEERKQDNGICSTRCV